MIPLSLALLESTCECVYVAWLHVDNIFMNGFLSGEQHLKIHTHVRNDRYLLIRLGITVLEKNQSSEKTNSF